MRFSYRSHDQVRVRLDWQEVTGAVGDSITVLPIVVAVGALTDLSLGVMLVWFGIFQVVWGVYFGLPISVEPMKVLAALILAGGLTTGELVVAGVLVGAIMLLIGITGTLAKVGVIIGDPVVRGIQLAVALVLLETGLRIGVMDLWYAALAVGIVGVLIASGHWNMSAFAVLLVGGAIAVYHGGVPAVTVPHMTALMPIDAQDVTRTAAEATLAQVAMTVGNAALATSLLLRDFFERDVSPDSLSSSMGVTNLVSVPFGALPMCHGSGGVAGKYAFGARTAGANLILGAGYLLVAVFAVGIVAVYPVAVLGVILVIIAFQLGITSLRYTSDYALVIAIGVIGILINIGVAFVFGVIAYLVFTHRDRIPIR